MRDRASFLVGLGAVMVAMGTAAIAIAIGQRPTTITTTSTGQIVSRVDNLGSSGWFWTAMALFVVAVVLLVVATVLVLQDHLGMVNLQILQPDRIHIHDSDGSVIALKVRNSGQTVTLSGHANWTENAEPIHGGWDVCWIGEGELSGSCRLTKGETRDVLLVAIYETGAMSPIRPQNVSPPIRSIHNLATFSDPKHRDDFGRGLGIQVSFRGEIRKPLDYAVPLSINGTDVIFNA